MDKLAIILAGSVVMAVVIVLLPPTLKMNRSKRDWFYSTIAILGAIMALGAIVYGFIQ